MFSDVFAAYGGLNVNAKKDKRSRHYYGIRRRWIIWAMLLGFPLYILPVSIYAGLCEILPGLGGDIFNKKMLAYLFGGTYDPKSVVTNDAMWKEWENEP